MTKFSWLKDRESLFIPKTGFCNMVMKQRMRYSGIS